MTMTNDTNDTTNAIPTVRGAHEFKEVFLPHFRKAFADALKEIGLELKGPRDVETRHAVKGAMRAVMEIAADAGWGWGYAQSHAAEAVGNVFGYRSKMKQMANTQFATAGCATETAEDDVEGEPDEDLEEEDPYEDPPEEE